MNKNYAEWEPKNTGPEVRRCTTCQYEWFSTRFGPCSFCPEYENWKPVENCKESEVNCHG